jgi:hypothetical protein
MLHSWVLGSVAGVYGGKEQSNSRGAEDPEICLRGRDTEVKLCINLAVVFLVLFVRLRQMTQPFTVL